MNERRTPPNEILMEAAATAHRRRDATGRILPSPEWFDLSEADRDRLFALQEETRLIESALDPRGLNGTMREVLRRIAFIDQLGGE